MIDNKIEMNRLIKVLALTDSDKEGETIAAFLMAKRILDKAGVKFRQILIPSMKSKDHASKSDNKDRASKSDNKDRASKSDNKNRASKSDNNVSHWEIMMLKRRVSALRAELDNKSHSLHNYKEAVEELVKQVWALNETVNPEESHYTTTH